MSKNTITKVFFYCLPENFEDKREYPHMAIALGEGLKKLGIELYSNENFWQIEPNCSEYLFKYDPNIEPEDCSIIVFNHEWFCSGDKNFPEKLLHSDKKYLTVLLDNFESNKGYRHLSFTPEFSRKFDFIFKAHCGSKFNYPDNCIPWAFGLSERILKETNNTLDFQARKKELIINYRSSCFRRFGKKIDLTHTVRRAVEAKFEPSIENIIPINKTINSVQSHPSDPYHHLKWVQTGKRHYPEYYDLLKNSVACACFGGWFVSPWLKNPGETLSEIQKSLYRKVGWVSNRILQWDSWRFWESLAAGCTTFHLDFEKYGVVMPVMPENWKHYIGVDLDNVSETIERINSEPEIIERIAIEGRKWAIENYSPMPTAIRFLEAVLSKLPKS